MHIKIFADNSFESLSATSHQITFASRIKDLQESIKEHKKMLKDRKGGLAPMKRIIALRLQLQRATPEKKETLRKQIQKLRFDNGLGPRVTLSTLKRDVAKWEKAIVRDQKQIERIKAKEAELKAKTKATVDKAKAQPRKDVTPVKKVVKPATRSSTAGPKTAAGVDRAITKQKALISELKEKHGKLSESKALIVAHDLKKARAKLRDLRAKAAEHAGIKTTTGRVSKGHEDKPTSKATHSATKRQAQTKVVKTVPEKKSAAGSGMGAAKTKNASGKTPEQIAKIKARIDRMEDKYDDMTAVEPTGRAKSMAWHKRNEEYYAKIDALRESIGEKPAKKKPARKAASMAQRRTAKR